MRKKQKNEFRKKAILLGLFFLLGWTGTGCRSSGLEACKTTAVIRWQAVENTVTQWWEKVNWKEEVSEDSWFKTSEFSAETQPEDSPIPEGNLEEESETSRIPERSSVIEPETSRIPERSSVIEPEASSIWEPASSESPMIPEISSPPNSSIVSSEERSPEQSIPVHQHVFIERRIVTSDAWEEVIYEARRYAVLRCKACGTEFSAQQDPAAVKMDGVYYSQWMDQEFKQNHCSPEHNPQHQYDFYTQRSEIPVDRIWHEEEYRILRQCECGEVQS